VLVGVILVFGFVKRMATRDLVRAPALPPPGDARPARPADAHRPLYTVNSEQSTIEPVLQIGTVDFDTAGPKDSEVRFVGIAAPGHAVEEAVDRAARGRRTRPPRPASPARLRSSPRPAKPA